MNLKEVQEKIKKLEKKNNWVNSPDAKISFLVEELGEVCKWVRKSRNRSLTEEEKDELNKEFADVLQHLISLANDFKIDLEEGLRKKKKF
jgi:NTP pyrophosphatase (non-canonical NTP hydrolase)